MNSSSKYLEQFNRVKRWYQEFALTDQGRPHDRPSDFYQDQAYAFFQNRDLINHTIKNDRSVGVAADKVEAFINSNEELQLCADICNGTKHLRLARARSGQDPRFGQRKFKVQVGGPPTTISVKYTIDTLVGPVDAFKLATKCLEAWENFIRSNISNEASI